MTVSALLAQNPQLFLGEDLLAWLVLAFGAALVVGNLAAIIRPPEHVRDGATSSPKSSSVSKKAPAGAAGRPPLGRSIAMIVVGLLAAVWGLASLIG